jgi:hypothetical protein
LATQLRQRRSPSRGLTRRITRPRRGQGGPDDLPRARVDQLVDQPQHRGTVAWARAPVNSSGRSCNAHASWRRWPSRDADACTAATKVSAGMAGVDGGDHLDEDLHRVWAGLGRAGRAAGASFPVPSGDPPRVAAARAWQRCGGRNECSTSPRRGVAASAETCRTRRSTAGKPRRAGGPQGDQQVPDNPSRRRPAIGEQSRPVRQRQRDDVAWPGRPRRRARLLRSPPGRGRARPRRRGRRRHRPGRRAHQESGRPPVSRPRA